MKILFLSNAASIHTVRWVNSLSKRGHEVHLIYKFDDEPKENKISENVLSYRLKYSGSKGYLLNVKQLKKLFNIIKPDVVNAHYASGYGTLARLARLKPLILSVWGSDVFDFPYQNKLKKKIVVDNLRYASEIASTSMVMADQVKKLLNEEYKNITITPFGVDLESFQCSSTKKDLDEIIIGNIKSLKKIYGLNYLIEALRILKDRLILNNNLNLSKKIKLYIYGDGPEKENLINLINRLNMEETIFLKGRIPNNKVPSILDSFAIFCATSIQESFGVSIIEAMAMELPVVATAVPGFKEIVNNNITGLIVDNMNSLEIAKALEKLVYNEQLRIEMGKNGRIKVKEQYDWNHNVNKMIDLYNIVAVKE